MIKKFSDWVKKNLKCDLTFARVYALSSIMIIISLSIILKLIIIMISCDLGELTL